MAASTLLALGGTVFTNFAWPEPLLQGLEATLPTSLGTIVRGVGFDEYRVAYDTLPDSENEDRGLSVEFNKTFGNGVTFTSVSAYRAFDTFDLIDVDFTDVPILTRTNDAKQQSFSQEFRLAGEWGDNSNYVAGVYYFGQDIDQKTEIIAPEFTPGTPASAFYSGLLGVPEGVPGIPLAVFIPKVQPFRGFRPASMR